MLLNINNKINITLCGMMGSGKSAIGKILANKLDYNFIDVDKMIEMETNKTIRKIFEDEGDLSNCTKFCWSMIRFPLVTLSWSKHRYMVCCWLHQ